MLGRTAEGGCPHGIGKTERGKITKIRVCGISFSDSSPLDPEFIVYYSAITPERRWSDDKF
jgi:hypothetical protein